MRFVVEVILPVGGLPGFLGPSCTGGALSASVVSVCVSAVLRGEKKLQFNIAFGCSLTAADVGTGLVDLLAVYEV
jgi:hypothetical protein